MGEKEDLKETIFEKLKNIRLKKNLELSKIAEKTKIHIKYLEAIESGNLKEIPEVYDKLFFQTYLTSLNIKKKDEYLDEFYKIRKEVRPQYTTTIQKIKSLKTDSKRFSKLKQIYLIAPILIVVILIVFFAIIKKILRCGNDNIRIMAALRVQVNHSACMIVGKSTPQIHAVINLDPWPLFHDIGKDRKKV